MVLSQLSQQDEAWLMRHTFAGNVEYESDRYQVTGVDSWTWPVYADYLRSRMDSFNQSMSDFIITQFAQDLVRAENISLPQAHMYLLIYIHTTDLHILMHIMCTRIRTCMNNWACLHMVCGEACFCILCYLMLFLMHATVRLWTKYGAMTVMYTWRCWQMCCRSRTRGCTLLRSCLTCVRSVLRPSYPKRSARWMALKSTGKL